MSRIGKQPINVPAGVTVTVDTNNLVVVEGKLGKLEQKISKLIKVEVNSNVVTLTTVDSSKEANSMHGLYRTLISNMVEGVTNGFSKTLIINGVGYKAFDKGDHIQLNIGYSHPVEVRPMEGIKLSCPTVTEVKVEGASKEKVGQMAASIRAIKPVEPYHAYGIRYSDEVVIRKEGKTAGKK
ncbi:MAG: 50S ribosomal protein L6 [Clostridia bacterium]|nr:50S ribosomal protein L6 [Clostridia bacterium]